MKLQTQIPLQKQSENLIDYNSNIFLLGSCFVENIGEKLEYFKFQNLINPLGILFHPLAVESLISKAILKKEFTEKDIFFHNEQWHSFDAHSKLSSVSKVNLLNNLNKAIKATNQQLHKSTHIVITLGTAWIYKHIEKNNIVANCHKVPQKNFEKMLLSVEEITNSLNSIIALIKKVNHHTSIIFTLSPVRHLKDGFVENTQSKAHLITAIQSVLSTQEQSRSLFYFPSYEIMMDELRDYRFYNEDMIHPNATAINFIWERFQEVWISASAQKTMDDIKEIQKGMLHKPFNSNSERYQEFLQKLEAKKNLLKSKFSHIQF
ncbi:MAG: GSCFA domain-containing protein [Flavobacteriaceae bacterium]